MKNLLRPAITLFILLTAITGVAYPPFITAIAQTAFLEEANGSLIVKDGKQIGSQLIGQNFTDPGYFWGRPSATAPTPYNGAPGGSNLGPCSTRPWSEAVKGRIDALKTADPENKLSGFRPIWSPPRPADSTRTSARLPPTTRSNASPARASSTRRRSNLWSPATPKIANGVSFGALGSTFWRSTWRSTAQPNNTTTV